MMSDISMCYYWSSMVIPFYSSVQYSFHDDIHWAAETTESYDWMKCYLWRYVEESTTVLMAAGLDMEMVVD